MGLCRPPCTIIAVVVVAFVGFLFLVAGVVMLLHFPIMIKEKIASRVAVNNGTDTFKMWQKSPIAVTFGIYLFHVDNADQVVQKGAKPKLVQKGPYVFKQYKEKVDVKFDENDFVSYLGKRTFYYDKEATNGSLSDTITILNVPYLGVSKRAMGLSGPEKMMLNMLTQFYIAKPFVTRNVSQLLFEGYVDNFIKALAAKTGTTILPNNTFGFLYGQNNSLGDGPIVVNRGNKDVSLVGEIVSYYNMTSLKYWNSEYCNMINGTDGSQFPPFVTEDEVVLYTPELCRSLYLSYQDDVIVESIRLRRYTAGAKLLAASKDNPENECYCPASGCLLSGVLNVSSCRKGAPILVSLPHFYLADEKYINDVEGLNPQQELHETFLDVEPNTGIVMNAAKRLQVNADVKPVRGFSGYQKMPSVFLPLLWVSETATISPTSAQRFRSQVQWPMTLGKSITYALLGIGPFCWLCLVTCLIISSVRARTKRMSRLNARVSAETNGPAAEKLLTRPVFA